MLRQGGGRHQQAHRIIPGAQGLAQPLQTNAVLPDPGGPVSSRMCFSVAQAKKFRKWLGADYRGLPRTAAARCNLCASLHLFDFGSAFWCTLRLT